ncbi:MAG: gliding motility-associated C-terminal domain-containing protein [Bacteroidota bacterium]
MGAVIRISWLICWLLCWSGTSISPLPLNDEICDNGIDDDGDGFIDCLDGDCIYSGFCSPCETDIPTAASFHTGFDETNETVLSAGAIDSSWTWSTTLTGTESFSFAGTCSCDPAGAWVCNPVSGADWIASTQNCLTGGVVFYHHTFEVDSLLVSFYFLNLIFYADDFIEEIYLNGLPLNFSTSPPNYLQGTGENLTINSGFVAGANRLSVEVRNTGGPGGLLLTADPNVDFDQDGVRDHQDRCLLSPNGFPVDTDGCTYFLTQTDTILCNGQTINWQNQTISTVGTYLDTIPSSLGCDSILELRVQETVSLEVFIDTTICQGNELLIGGRTYTQAGSYVDTLLNPQGCDSIFHVELEVLPFFDVEIDTSIVVCEGVQVAGVEIEQDTLVIERLLAHTGCDSTVRYNVTAVQKPSNNFSNVQPFCLGEQLQLSAIDLAGASYVWSTGATDTDIQVQSGGLFTLETSVQFCRWVDSVVVPEPIDLMFELGYSPLICAGTEAGFLEVLVQPMGIPPHSWIVNGELYDSLDRLDGMSSGTYELEVQDAIGCSATQEIVIDTITRLQVNLPTEVEIVLGDSYDLILQTNRSEEELTQIRWLPDTFVSCQDCLDPVLTPFYSLEYQIQLTDTFGCEAMEELSLRLKRQDRVFIPSAFSPNNDGINDEFVVFLGPEVGQVTQFLLFNRWGKLVFDNREFSPTAQLRWDGITQSGKAAPEGVYVLLLQYEYLDGVQRSLSRSISLIR